MNHAAEAGDPHCRAPAPCNAGKLYIHQAKPRLLTMEYHKLKHIGWQQPEPSTQLTSPGLTRLGLAHGFFGVKTPAPAGSVHVRQVHGTKLVQASADQPLLEADGIYTTSPGVTIAVKTADCVPLLIADQERRIGLAIHAGWRGLTAGIVVQAIAHAKSLGIEPAGLVAAIGPCIRTDRFQVGPEVVEALHQPACGLTGEQPALCTLKGYGDRWHVDLQTACALILLNQGLQPASINVLQICTFSHPQWHSARREGPGFGSNWSWLRL